MPDSRLRLLLPAAFRRKRHRPASALAVAPSREAGFWLLAAATVTLAPHAAYLPPWMSALGAVLLGWRAYLQAGARAAPNPWLTLVLAVAAGVAVRAEFGYFFGREPGVALLTLLLCLKLLELRSIRDARAVVLLCFFLQLGLFFNNEGLPIGALALLGTLISTASLLTLEDGTGRATERLRTAALLLAQSLPLMLLLFVLFPRISSPLWGLPADAQRGTTGLSDTMSPGSISELGLSEEIAFRADFASGTPPAPALRYWRGPVLTEFDGRTWRPGRTTIANRPAYTTSGPRLDYRLTLEAHGQRWLLALDFAAANLPRVAYTDDFQALNPAAVRARMQIALAAYPATQVGLDEKPATLAAALRLPADGNPRSRGLARELAAGTNAPEQIVQRALTHLRTGGYAYTLQPPLLGRNVIDDFVFDTRRGFCEHYAAAFVFLMRAAGVPARVVTGYQGGELNPYDGTLIVRQSDAHAWAEVWLPTRGWVRVDPTAEVAPDRVTGDRAAAFSSSEALPLLMNPHLDWLRQIRLRWEATSHAWDRWVLGYNSDRQNTLLRQLGFKQPDWTLLAGLISLGCVTLLGLLFAWAQFQRRRTDPLDRSWDKFCGKLADFGLPRAAWEGPLDYGMRIALHCPQQAEALQQITRTYARLRYGRNPATDDIRALTRSIEQLTLK